MAEAFSLLWQVVRACEVQVTAVLKGTLIEIDKEILQKCSRETFL